MASIPPASARRRWFRPRFSLRGLLVLTTLAAIVAGYAAHLYQQKQRERQAAFFLRQRSVGLGQHTTWTPPAWLGQRLPADWFTHIDSVQCWHFRDEWMPHVAAFTHARRLHLSGGQLTSEGLQHLAPLRKLEDIYLEGSVDDALFEFVADCQPRRLVLRNTNVRGAGLAHVNPARLQILTLMHTPIDDEGLRHIGQMKHLRALLLNRIIASEAGLRQLRHLDRLETLCLVNFPTASNLTDWLPPNVRVVYLRSLPLTDDHLAGLEAYEQLEQVQMLFTEVTPGAADRLDADLPHCRVRLHPPQGRVNSVDSFRLDDGFFAHPGTVWF